MLLGHEGRYSLTGSSAILDPMKTVGDSRTSSVIGTISSQTQLSPDEKTMVVSGVEVPMGSLKSGRGVCATAIAFWRK
jgi:hypothetical protein